MEIDPTIPPLPLKDIVLCLLARLMTRSFAFTEMYDLVTTRRFIRYSFLQSPNSSRIIYLPHGHEQAVKALMRHIISISNQMEDLL